MTGKQSPVLRSGGAQGAQQGCVSPLFLPLRGSVNVLLGTSHLCSTALGAPGEGTQLVVLLISQECASGCVDMTQIEELLKGPLPVV